MAFRIHESVIRGEIDNRVKGFVRGEIWVAGRTEPIRLELNGNAWPDLAGCLLTFRNPLKPIEHPHLGSLNSIQKGSIGDLTASRKVRVFDLPLKEALEMMDRNEKPAEHMANCLYLEWYSESNGRVVIESTDYELTISAPEWRMTRDEDEDRAQQAAAGMDGFMQKLTDNIETHKRDLKSHEEEWDEFDYEKFMKECDARTDKYGELLDKYGDSDEAQAKIEKEMGWDRDNDPDDGPQFTVEEMNEICEAAANEPQPDPDPNREGIDWIRTEDGDIHHPLQNRCYETALAIWKQVDQLDIDKFEDKDLGDFLLEFQTTGAKLAGALNGVARGESLHDAAFTVALLKRALDHLHKAQAALEAVATKKLLPNEILIKSRQELFEIREGILNLMNEFRGQA